MAIHKEYADPAKDPGDKVVLGEDADTGLEVALMVRRIPESQEREFRRQFRTSKIRTVRMRNKAQEVDVDTERERDRARARACYALLDSVNFEVLPGDEGAAAKYRALLPGVDVTVGQPLKLDGRWSEQLKDSYLAEHVDLVTSILEHVDDAQAGLVQRNEDLEKN